MAVRQTDREVHLAGLETAACVAAPKSLAARAKEVPTKK
jgi:hypothetical protein